MRGIRMSISTTSGATCAMSSSPASPSSASPTISMAASPRRIIESAARTSASSSTITTRTGRRRFAHAGHGNQARTTKSPSDATCSRRPPISSARSVEPEQPEPRTGRLAGRGPDPDRVPHLEHQLAARAAAQRDVDGGVRRVLARVREALLDHPVRAAPDRVRCSRQVFDLVVQPHVRARPLGLLDQRRQVDERRLGPLRVARRVDGAQDSEDLVQVLQGAVGVERVIAAASATSASLSPRQYSSAPACSATNDSRCASTSCISRAIRARSVTCACSIRSACSRSARSARSCSVASRSRRAPMYMPGAITHGHEDGREQQREEP